MSHTLAITINGTLGLQGGANNVVWPTTLPAPDANGVRSFTLLQAAVGTFFFRELAATAGQGNVPGELFNLGWIWIKNIALDCAAATQACRVTGGKMQGMRATTYVWQTVIADAYMIPLKAAGLIPPGGIFTVETDDTDNTFTGNNVAGPHQMILEYEFIVGFDELCCARRATQAVYAQSAE